MIHTDVKLFHFYVSVDLKILIHIYIHICTKTLSLRSLHIPTTMDVNVFPSLLCISCPCGNNNCFVQLQYLSVCLCYKFATDISSIRREKPIFFEVKYNILNIRCKSLEVALLLYLQCGQDCFWQAGLSIAASFGQCAFSLLSWLIFEGQTLSHFHSFSVTAVAGAEFLLFCII